MDKFTIKINNLIDLLKLANESHVNKDYKKQAEIMLECSNVFLDLSLNNFVDVVNGAIEEIEKNETQ